MEENIVLCVSNSYEQKFFINPKFEILPSQIKAELKIMCVLYTEEVGGIFTLEFKPDGELIFKSIADERDYLYDEIGSVLKIKQIQQNKKELLESLEMFYKVFYLKRSL